MKQVFPSFIGALVCGSKQKPPLAGFDARNQFNPGQKDDIGVARNINAAFLILLSGPKQPLYDTAKEYLETLSVNEKWKSAARFMISGAALITNEVEALYGEDRDFKEALNAAGSFLTEEGTDGATDPLEPIWRVLFPEGVDCHLDPAEKIASLRSHRRVGITHPNPSPISEPSKQLLFLSNLLVTTPVSADSLDRLPYGSRISQKLKGIMAEKQRYWYDHPIQIGVHNDKNEAIYGLRGLDDAMKIEKKRGLVGPEDRLNCLLSVSVTHAGLHGIVKKYLRKVYESTEPFIHLTVYLYSEQDTEQIVKEILLPAMVKYLNVSDGVALNGVFGVDGEYGRHYSFLKAMSAFWQVLIDPSIKGSFKLDLDQVFDQTALIRETGCTALEHFKTPLWGALGEDADGNPVELGLMAGALVNAQDVAKSLFTPDVPLPDDVPRGEPMIFFSPLTMGISTRAEMMTRYDSESLDGIHGCIQRVHVTGGTTAALIESVRKYRPFTPTFIGRAEDQAYFLGSLFSKPGENLRYLHNPGLVMRHDKHDFAGEAIEGAKPGKYVGDLIRILFFSYYARALPWPVAQIKKTIDPFTGCFRFKTSVYRRISEAGLPSGGNI